MEQLKNTLLCAGKDALDFMSDLAATVGKAVADGVCKTVEFTGEKLCAVTKKYSQPLLMAVAILSLVGAVVSGAFYLLGRRK